QQRLGPDGSRNPARVRAALSDRLGATYPQHRAAVEALLAAMEAEPPEPPSPTLPATPTPTPTPTPAPPTVVVGGSRADPAPGARPTRSGSGRRIVLGLALLLLVAGGVTAAVLLLGGGADGDGGGRS